jgi:hypothetical protein
MSIEEELLLDTGNSIMLGLFTIEMVIKMIALGARMYFAANQNSLDCFVVTFSLLLKIIVLLVPES